MPFATFVCALLTAMFMVFPIHGAGAAPPDKGDTRSSVGGPVSVPHAVIRTLSCRIEGAQGNLAGANLYVRNESGVAIPTGTKIQWSATPQVATGIYTLGAPLLPGESKMLAKAYDWKCTAKIVP